MSSHWLHCNTKSSLWSLEVSKPGGEGVNLKIYPKSEHELLFLYALVFPYIFLLFDCFEWVLIDCIVKCKVHSVLWQFQPGGVNLKIYPGKSENELLFLYALVFPYIFLLFDGFEWALIDHIVKCKVHSVLWQFQMGGRKSSDLYGYIWKWAIISICTGISLYIPIIWLFRMGTHWLHCNTRSSLWA